MAVHMQLLSDRPVNDYETFFVDLMHGLDKYKIRSVAVVAIFEEPEEDGSDAITGYFNIGIRGRQMAASLLQEDTTKIIAQDAVRDMLGLT